MRDLNTIDDIFTFAIEGEIEAAAFYRDLAAHVSNAAMQKTLEEFAEEEEGHRSQLEKVKAEGHFATAGIDVRNLGIADYLEDVELSTDMTYQAILVAAMKKERAAHLLYSELAGAAPNADMAEVFKGLAAEEAKHRLAFETEYDEIMTEN